jgi:hypothetical protein
MQSYPKIGKFRVNKAFPLFDALGELYDGQLAEGTYNFTSTEPARTQVEFNPEVISVEDTHSHSGVQVDTEGGMQEANFQDRVAGHEEPHLNPTVAAAPSTSTENEPKKRRSNGDVAAMMERYIEMKTKQIEGAKDDFKNVDEFSIKNCIARLNTMEVSREERAKALGVFKSEVNRELFICADVETALIWLRGEMT